MRGAKQFANLQRRQKIAPRERWTIVRLSHQAREEKQSVTARQKTEKRIKQAIPLPPGDSKPLLAFRDLIKPSSPTLAGIGSRGIRMRKHGPWHPPSCQLANLLISDIGGHTLPSAASAYLGAMTAYASTLAERFMPVILIIQALKSCRNGGRWVNRHSAEVNVHRTISAHKKSCLRGQPVPEDITGFVVIETHVRFDNIVPVNNFID